MFAQPRRSLMRHSVKMLAIVIGLLLIGAARAADPSAQAQAAIDKGLEYLKTQQKPDHSWQRESDPPAISAIVLKAFMGDKKYDADQPFLEKGYDTLLSNQKPNGGIYKDMLANYN